MVLSVLVLCNFAKYYLQDFFNMPNRFILLLATLITMTSNVIAQDFMLTREANIMSDSDEISLTRMPYFSSSRCGKGLLWDFTESSTSKRHFNIWHQVDTVGRHLQLTDRDITYYQNAKDTLLIVSKESPLYKITYNLPILAMSYPFAFGDSIDTYFVYNDLGQLRFVLSPEYQNNGKKAIFGYEYRYDDRGNIVKKFLPQCGYIQYWYDNDNRLIYMQDGRMREKGLYRFYLYDKLSRIVVEGTCTSCNRGITKIVYDLRNNPRLIQFSDGSQTEYVYSALGEKLKTIYKTAIPNITNLREVSV